LSSHYFQLLLFSLSIIIVPLLFHHCTIFSAKLY
jgi:hypothetical protein